MPKEGEFDNSCVLLLETENHIKLLEPFFGTKKHHKMQCMACNHVWTATPLSKRQTYKKYGVSGCPNCNTNRKNLKYDKHRQQVLDTLLNRGIQILDKTYDGRLRLDYTKTLKEEKILVKNINCGHEFFVTPLNLIQSSVECGICGPQKRVAPLTAWSKANSAKWKETATEWQQYKAVVTSLTEQVYKQHHKKINPFNLKRGKAGVDGAYHLDHIVPKRFCFDNNIPPEICADESNLQMIGWLENVGSRNHIKGTIPPLFFQFISTNTKLEQYAKTLMGIFPNSKPFVKIDDVIATVYDELSNRAIIVLPLDKSYADSKSGLAVYKAFKESSTQFIVLFEDELENVELLSAKLKHYTFTGGVEKIHARKCVIKYCTPEEKKTLLNANHIQGNDNAQINYGAYYNNKLVAVMTFTVPRLALGQKNKTEGVWELSRFCTDVNYRIPGIASKLLTHFKRNHCWEEIYSFADIRWSVGNMYYQLGFQLTKINPPSYFYVIGGKRKHRWNYRKDIIKKTLPNYDATLTEYQNMVNHGFYRVWDCGTLKFSIYSS